ncbi:Heat shock cognate 71 kDa protein, partial [Orchesella cincta]
ATINEDNIINGHDFNEKISRSRFEELNMEYFRKTVTIVQKALKAANTICSADAAVAYGAAVQAPLLNGVNEETLLSLETINDVTPMALGISTNCAANAEGYFVIIQKNTPIPHCAKKLYNISGDNAVASKNDLLGTLELTDITFYVWQKKIEVEMGIDRMGILSVKALCKRTNEKKSIVLKMNKGRLSEQDKSKIADSIKNPRSLQIYNTDESQADEPTENSNRRLDEFDDSGDESADYESMQRK